MGFAAVNPVRQSSGPVLGTVGDYFTPAVPGIRDVSLSFLTACERVGGGDAKGHR